MSALDNEPRFTKLYKAMVDEIYGFVYMRTGLDPSVSEDITQEVFMDVYKGLNRFKGLCSERTWVFSIARNKVSDFYRVHYRKTLESVPLDDECLEKIDDSSQDIEDWMNKVCDSQFIRHCLNSLPEHYRITLLLKYVDGRSTKEIALISDKTAKAVENMIKRSKDAFIKQYRSLKEKENVKDEK